MILKTDFLLKKTYYNSKQQCSVPPSTVRISNEKFPACLLHCVPSRCLPRAGHTGVCNYSSTWKSFLASQHLCCPSLYYLSLRPFSRSDQNCTALNVHAKPRFIGDKDVFYFTLFFPNNFYESICLFNVH